MEHAKQYFDNHTSVEQLFFTSDNLAFFDEQNAINHAKKLKDKGITTRTRDEVYEETENLLNTWNEEYDPLDEPDAE